MSELLARVPPVTRWYVGLTVAITLLCTVELLSPFDLYLNWRLALGGQIWRFLTCFLYYGELRFSVAWSVYLSAFYSAGLENEFFRGRPADFAWFLVTTGALCLGLSYYVGHRMFLATAQLNVLAYVWCRKNPHAQMGVALFAVDAPYLPWILALVSWIAHWGVFDHAAGILAGHVYYFFQDIYPLLPASQGLQLFAAPSLVKWLLGQKEELGGAI